MGIGIANFDSDENNMFFGAMHLIRTKTKIFTNKEQFHFKVISWGLSLKLTSLIRENKASIKVYKTNTLFNDLALVLRCEQLVQAIRMLRDNLQKYLSFQYCELLLYDNISIQ
jgi:hypothetical protein